PGRRRGSAGFEYGRDVLPPIRLVQLPDQEMSRDTERGRGGAGAVAAALQGEEADDPAAMDAAEPVRGAPAHRVADEEDGNARQLGMEALRPELGECPQQRFVA